MKIKSSDTYEILPQVTTQGIILDQIVSSGWTPQAGKILIWAKTDNVLQYTDGEGDTTPIGGGGISNIVEDATPQLGGNLDVLDKKIFSSTGKVEITGTTLTGVDSAFRISNSFAAGNYIDLGDIRRIGVVTGGTLFMGYNTDWDATAVEYKRASADEVAGIEFGNEGEIRLFSAPYGSAGTSFTPAHNLVVKNDGLVGIGTDSPKSSVHIIGNTPGTVGSHPAGQLIIQSPGTSDNSNAVISGYASDAQGEPYQQLWYLGSSSSSNSDIILLNRLDSKLHLGTNGVARMTIDDSGNVGLGTSDPDRMFHLKGSDANIHIEREDQNGATVFLSNINGTNTTHWKIEALNNWAGAGNGTFSISDDGIASGGTSTPRFTIDENGKIDVPVSITSPILRLDSTAYFQLQGSNPTLAFDSNDYMDFNRSTNHLSYKVGGTEKLGIASSGSIVIPSVYSDTDPGAANVLVGSNGHLVRSTSSRKIKKDIVEDVNPEWALKFKPVTFASKTNGSKHIGFVAEDMRDIDSRFATEGDLPGLETIAILAALTVTVQMHERRIALLETA